MTAVVVHHSPMGDPGDPCGDRMWGARDRASRGHNPTTPLGVPWAATVGVAVILVLLCGAGGRGERTSFHHCDVSARAWAVVYLLCRRPDGCRGSGIVMNRGPKRLCSSATVTVTVTVMQ